METKTPTVKDLADEIGVGRATVNYWIVTNKVPGPDVATNHLQRKGYSPTKLVEFWTKFNALRPTLFKAGRKRLK